MLINTRPLGTEQRRGRRREGRVAQSRGGLSVPATACGAQLASSITQINFENHSGTLHLIATKTLGNPPSPCSAPAPAAAAVVCNCCCSNSNYAIDRGSGCGSNPLPVSIQPPESSHKSSNIHFSLRMELFFLLLLVFFFVYNPPICPPSNVTPLFD